MYYLGIDIGSLSCDAVLIDGGSAIAASTVVPTGSRNREAIARVTDEVLRIAGISRADIAAVVSTGYGRDQRAFDPAGLQIRIFLSADRQPSRQASVVKEFVDSGRNDDPRFKSCTPFFPASCSQGRSAAHRLGSTSPILGAPPAGRRECRSRRGIR